MELREYLDSFQQLKGKQIEKRVRLLSSLLQVVEIYNLVCDL